MLSEFKENKHFKIIRADILVCIFFACTAFYYNYRENLSPDRFLFVIQLCTFWFILRILVHFFPVLKTGMPYLILLAGLVEAIWGLGQLYGYFPSKHALFKTTGSFLNPGPYGGFIALIFPLALHYGLYNKQKNKFLFGFSLLTGIVCFMVFPATLSRTAWIAAILGCLFVLLFDTRFSATPKKTVYSLYCDFVHHNSRKFVRHLFAEKRFGRRTLLYVENHHLGY